MTRVVTDDPRKDLRKLLDILQRRTSAALLLTAGKMGRTIATKKRELSHAEYGFRGRR